MPKRISYLARTGRTTVTDDRAPITRNGRKAAKIGDKNFARAYAARRAAQIEQSEADYRAALRLAWPHLY